MILIQLQFSRIAPVLLAAPDPHARERVVLLVGILIGICLIGGAAILMLRRRLFQKESDAASAGTLFEQLRGMRDRGEISAEEFEKTRQAMIRKVRNTVDTAPRDPASKKV